MKTSKTVAKLLFVVGALVYLVGLWISCPLLSGKGYFLGVLMTATFGNYAYLRAEKLGQLEMCIRDRVQVKNSMIAMIAAIITKTCKFSDFSPEKPPDVGTANFTSDGLLFDMMFAPQCGFHHLLLSQVMIYQVGF